MKKKSKAVTYVLGVISALLFIAGVAIIYFSLFHEQKATELYGEIKLYTAEVIRENGGTPPGEETDEATGLPSIRLEGEGGQRELDWCTGAFVHLLSYHDKNNLPPVWASHNGCGGSVILNWDIGTHFVANGQEYRIIDSRRAPQRGGTTDDVAGIQGEFVLQTCTFDGHTMIFLGAERVKSEAELEKERKDAEEALAEETEQSSGTPEPQETNPPSPSDG